MKYNPRFHHRRSTRLKGYNYARAGSYFITLSCYNKIELFGEIKEGKMILNEFGVIAYKEWVRTPVIRPNIDLGSFVIMPDHLHGIIIIREDVSGWTDEESECQGGCNTPLHSDSSPRSSNTSRQSFLSPSQTLGAIVRGYMGTVTSQINKIRNTHGDKVWQRNYNDHIIRNKWDFHRITKYIIRNPKNYRKNDTSF